MYSRIRGAGADQLMPNLRTMCPRTWLPSPSVNLPEDMDWRSQPIYAMSIGLRAKARAMDVLKPMRSVCSAAMGRARNGLWLVSDELYVSKPSRSARLADSAISLGVLPVSLAPTFN